MRAVCWHGRRDVRVDNIPDPKIENPRDAIIKITATAICGSDLHLYDGVIPTMAAGDVLGHEFMGEVVEVGRGVSTLKKGDRVVVPFTIACGGCGPCHEQLWSLCDNSNPNAWIAEKMYGYSGSALFGYSHMYGGFAGGQAEYVRVPYADVGPFKVPEALTDEQVLFLSDIFPTGYMAAENCDISEGDVVAVWGCGPVGQFAIKSAFILGADRVIAIDRVDDRLTLARAAGAETLNFDVDDIPERLRALTGGRGPDACIDAVGLEAHGSGSFLATYDKVKTMAFLATDRLEVLRQAVLNCKKGGVVSIPGVYGGYLDKVPMGAAFAKGLTMKMGQTHVHKYMPAFARVDREPHDRSIVRDQPSTAARSGAGRVSDVPGEKRRVHQSRTAAVAAKATSARGRSPAIYVGTAGWTIPRGSAHRCASAGTHLERYARVMPCVEINSSFYRPHLASTYARWAASAGDEFRFSVKVPKVITHELRLRRSRKLFEQFLEETGALGHRRGPLLVQLPPSFEFEPRVVAAFFKTARELYRGPLVCEPRHSTWFARRADALLERLRVARVAADPPTTEDSRRPGGWKGLAYFRLHGSPRMYWSRYDTAYIEQLARTVRELARDIDVWCIFDNTAMGTAFENACELKDALSS